MEFWVLILGLIFGLIIGGYLKGSESKNVKGVNDVLRATINDLEKELDGTKIKLNNVNVELGISNIKINNRDVLLEDYQKEHEILLKTISELRTKKIGLENNIELLTNNLSDENKELVSKTETAN